MSRKIIHTVVLAALAGWSALAQAEDPPGVVGRISAVQGQVTLVGDGEPVGAGLNWPVTADNHLTTASGARTEFRVGSTAVRVDGDSDLEITAMDDDVLRLRLNYGSVSIRVRSPELLRDFELSTPQARITMIEPGILRVDVDRTPDTSQISVLSGTARVDGAGSSVVVNNGRHVDVSTEDVRTSVARRDGFDIWAEDRDRLDSATTTTRYVSSGMTGYEELDRNGSWTDSAEYGPLWTPRNVAMDWAPYRDGRWIWMAPWGWTWIDNAPWGYAPSHYGRWVMVNRRWCWAPGRPAGRPVWAPALVGWVGGNGGGHRPGPGLGWYPLSPRDRFVPGYRVSSDYERRVTWTHNGKPFTPRNDWNGPRDGLTVVPRDQFDGHRNVVVNRSTPVIPPASFVHNVTPATPPAPPGRPMAPNRGGMGDRDHDGVPDRYDRVDNRAERNDRMGRVITAPSQPVQVPAQQPRGTISTLAPNQFGSPDSRPQTINPNDVRIELRSRINAPGQAGAGGQAQQLTPAPVIQVSPSQPPQPVRDRYERDHERQRGNDDNRRFRQNDEPRQQQAVQVQQPQIQQPQQPASQPRQFTPPPQPQRESRSEPRHEPERRSEEKGDRRNKQNDK